LEEKKQISDSAHKVLKSFHPLHVGLERIKNPFRITFTNVPASKTSFSYEGNNKKQLNVILFLLRWNGNKVEKPPLSYSFFR
jgi:hypothetical protein